MMTYDHLVVCCPVLQVEVQSLLVAEVVGGAKTTAQKSSLKNVSHLWEEVSTVECLKHTGSKRQVDFVEGENLNNYLLLSGHHTNRVIAFDTSLV